MSRRRNRFALTFHHEVVHFLQGLTTSTGHKYSLALLSLYKRMCEDSSRGRLTLRRMRKYRHERQFYESLSGSPWKGLKTRDMMESTAVIEAFMASFQDPTLAMFEDYLAEFYPDPAHPYRTVLEIVRDRFGLDMAVELVPRLTFIALNTSQPVRNFLRFLDILDGAPLLHALVQDTRALASAVGSPLFPELLSPEMLRDAHDVHPFLFSYVEELWAAGGLARWCDYFAKPSRLLRPDAPESLNGKFLPPLIVFSGGEWCWNGAAKSWTRDMQMFYFSVSAVGGACDRLLGAARPYQFCVHTACPVYETALCYSWYAPPPAGRDHKLCEFPKLFDTMFAATPTTLMEMRDRAGKAGRIWLQGPGHGQGRPHRRG